MLKANVANEMTSLDISAFKGNAQKMFMVPIAKMALQFNVSFVCNAITRAATGNKDFDTPLASASAGGTGATQENINDKSEQERLNQLLGAAAKAMEDLLFAKQEELNAPGAPPAAQGGASRPKPASKKAPLSKARASKTSPKLPKAPKAQKAQKAKA
jgi:hypothetical protein